MRIIALDYGTKSIGVAICDELQLTVRPLTTIRRAGQKRAQVIESLAALINENEAGAIVVGLPLKMSGERGEAVARVEKFIADLQALLSIPIITIDERLTSYEADQLLREMGVSLQERRARSDEYAAVIMLQDYLDGLARQNSQLSPEPIDFNLPNP
jgi:putative Holliday junction resolvase